MKLQFKQLMARMLFKTMRVFPIDKKKVVFSSFRGKYNDSPRIISEALSRTGKAKQVWIVNEGIDVPESITKAKPKSISSLYHLATARVWVDNSRKEIWVSKRKKQFYIQTWHGGVCIKKVEKDAEDRLPPVYVESAKNDSKMADIFVSEAEWRTRNYRSAFWYEGEIVKGGISRKQSIDEAHARKKVLDFFGINDNCHFVLYAPTFRNNHDLTCYDIDYHALINCLEKKYGGDWRIIIRLHPNISDSENHLVYSEKVLNGSDYPILNELLAISDMLITDFSGCMFDAVRRKLKLVLYASDYDDYLKNERGLYFDLSNFPAPLAKNNSQLLDIVNSFDVKKYEEDCQKMIDQLGFYDVDATPLIVDRILSVILK
ncbi:MAG: CDP-glycerol glycerophosphotransferase family protein [Clostridia bacterium]|nr:CDP-glycerol glycerophosphotransferase family protein [Clostridia bacterium]